jgi:hypothetical protein
VKVRQPVDNKQLVNKYVLLLSIVPCLFCASAYRLLWCVFGAVHFGMCGRQSRYLTPPNCWARVFAEAAEALAASPSRGRLPPALCALSRRYEAHVTPRAIHRACCV